ENAKKKMELQKIASDISDKVKEIQDKIKEAEYVESNPSSSTEELKHALTNLENIKTDLLPKLDEEFNKLPTTPEVDGLRNKTLEEQAKLVEDLNNAESAINERIYSIDELGDLIASADMKLDSINKKLDETPIYDIDEILKIEFEDVLPLNSVTDEINDAADRANKKQLPELGDISKKLNEITQKLGDKKKQAEEAIESQRKAAEELAEAERKAAEELAEAERQAAEAQKQAQDEIEKLVAAPLNEENISLIEEQLSKLPEDSPIYQDMKKKADEVKDKAEKVKNIKNDLDDIENTMKPAVEIKNENLSPAEKVKDTEEKLAKLKDARPKLLAITWSGVPEVDEEIKKKQQELDDLIKSLENTLEEDKDKQKALDSLDEYLDNVSEINALTDLPLDMKNNEGTSNWLAELYQKLQNALDNLKTLPSDKLDETSNEKLEQAIKVVENDIEKVLNDMEDLDKYDKEIKLLKEKTDKFISSLDNNTDSIDKILSRYKESPQPYNVATEDVEMVKPLFAKISTMIENNTDLIKNLDENGIDIDVLQEKSNNLQNKLFALQELEKKITSDLNRENELIAKKMDLEPKVYGLDNEIKQILQSEFSPNFVEKLQKDIALLQDNINCTIDDCEIPLNVVLHSPASDIWYLKDILDDAALSLADAKRDYENKLQLQKACDEIEKLTKQAKETIKKVSNINNDPMSNIDDLNDALGDIRLICDNILPKIEENIENLAISPELEDLKNNTFSEKEELKNELDYVKEKIHDRLNAIKEFDELSKLLKNKIMDPESKFEDIEDYKTIYNSLYNAADRALMKDDNAINELHQKLNDLVDKLTLEKNEELALQEEEKLQEKKNQEEMENLEKKKDNLISKLKNQNELADGSLLSPHTTPSTLTALLEIQQDILSDLNKIPSNLLNEKDQEEIKNGEENAKCLKMKLDKYYQFNSNKDDAFEKMEHIRMMLEILPEVYNSKQEALDKMETLDMLKDKLDEFEETKDNLFILSSELYPYEIPSSEARVYEEDIIAMREIVNDYKEKLKKEIEDLDKNKKLEDEIEKTPLAKKDIASNDSELVKHTEDHNNEDKSIDKIDVPSEKEEIKSHESDKIGQQDDLKNLESALADVDELSKLSVEANAPVDIKKPKESMNYLAALLKNLKDKLDSLKRIPTDKLPEDEKNKIKKAIENAERDSDKITAELDNLNKEQEKIDTLLDNKSKLLDKVPLKLIDADELLKRYTESPQPYEIAVKDLQNIQPIVDNLNKLNEESKDFAKLLEDQQLPSSDVIDSINNVNITIDLVKQLENKIKDDVN
uniref:KASH domain-containing protein n=1 Tax=Strongyloides stercoralis TaxID=6248 RepID=A0A0K0ETB8_STRER